MTILYHYTSEVHWPHIQKAGYLKVTDAGVTLNPADAPMVVHLTDEPNLRPATAGWARGSVVDKTRIRITVNVPDAVPWLEYAKTHNADQFWIENMCKAGGSDGSHWYVVERPIPSTEWSNVHIGDIPVGKRPLVRRKPLENVWRTDSGQPAMCDFCGEERSLAAYRYECRVFEIGDWSNGSADLPEDADWAACWDCSECIQKRDIPSLLAHSRASMTGEHVNRYGKHQTVSGMYSPATSEERIRAFFQHYTKKRWFVGRCDFCGVVGESVKWIYSAKPFRYTNLDDFGISRQVVSSSEWAACDRCSKLIDKKKQHDLIERMIERQISNSEEEGRHMSAGERAVTKRLLPTWVSEFFKNYIPKRMTIPDLFIRPVAPQAPIPAQVALDQKYTLLRWLEGSEGRSYIGSWNASYEGSNDAGRPATDGELQVWSRPLRYGDVFYWESHVAEEIRRASIELAENDNLPLKLHPQMLPASTGFFYADSSLGMAAGHTCRAIGWCVATSIKVIKESPVNPEIRSVMANIPANGQSDPSAGEGIILTFWSNRSRDTVLRPAGQMVWKYGQDFRDLMNMRTDGAVSASERPAMFASMLAFIQQKIVVAGKGQPVNAASTKRIEREYPNHEATVRIVTLRRVQRADYQKPSEPSGRTLSVQFYVPGFWRNQCFNPAGHKDAEKEGVGCNDHQSIPVAGHWRGPEDAPIKHNSEILYDVNR